MLPHLPFGPAWAPRTNLLARTDAQRGAGRVGRAARMALAPFVALCLPMGAHAADAPAAPTLLASAAPDKAVEEVVVTAERRSTKLQKTPAAITRIGAATLNDSGSHLVRDLSGDIPDVEIPRGGLTPTTQSFFIRGIGTSDPIQDPAVGLYVDDVFIPRPISDGGLFDLPDMDHVEVLRGPQGTLYGRNSDAGAIRLVTLDPGDTLHIVADAGFGNYGAVQTHDLISGPIVPGLVYGSLAFVHSDRQGTTYDPTIHLNVNNINYDSLRGKLKLTPTDDLEIVLSADGMLDHSNTAYYTPLVQKGGFNPNLTYVPIYPVNDLQSGGVALHVKYQLAPELTVKSITSVRAWDQAPVIYDNAGTATQYSANFIDYHQHDTTQELQLAGDYDRFNFVTGFYYFNEDFSVDRLTVSLFKPRTHTLNRTVTESYAGYAQGNYKITDKLTATVGVRYTLDHRTFDDGNYTTIVNPAAATLFGRYTVGSPIFTALSDHSWGAFTPKFGLDYQITPLIMTYVSYAEGFKGGGYDNRSANETIAHTPFSPETVDTYEVGAKADWLDHRLRTNLALFYNDYTNLQSTIYTSTVPGAPTELTNAGKAHTDGIELETTLIPIDGLTWTNNAGYLDSAYDKFLDAGPKGVAATGNRLPYAPRWNLTSAADYQVPLPIPGTVHAGGDLQYQTKAFSDVLNTPQAALPEQTILNFHAGYTTENSRWSALFTIRNALDRRFNQSGTYVPPVEFFLENPPRTFLFTIRYTL
jgi:iron complex outermembrane receptor protein